MTGPLAPSRVPAGATPEGDGILIGDGPVRVDAFIDFLCPFCRRFELSAGPALAGLVADGRVSLAYHPMNFLDQASTTNYSTRAAAASGCAADQGRFFEYARAVRQPAARGRPRAQRR
jgi:protein-disulfide isomerase